MSAQPATRPERDGDRIAQELQAVADEHDQQPPRPATLAEVAQLDPEQQAAWLKQTPAKQRWQALTEGEAPRRDARWDERAACSGTEVDLVELATQAAADAHARALCARCPVLAACATEARDHLAHGLWAGLAWNRGALAAQGHRAGRPAGTRNVTPHSDEDVAAWLRAAMQQEPGRTATALQAAAREEGIAYPTQLKRVADQLGIRRGGGAPWQLPDDEQQPSAGGRPLPGPLPGLPIDPAARTASQGLLTPRRPQQADEPPRRRGGQRSQPRRPRPRSQRRRKARP